ncbi:Crp/Fnr family transcriptional regulator [Pontibacter sp. MBLB2868]|uniref:Crp/Fnr family transcriptional regulator n=1 Tax=Pontibacter sp. MBLB2868 TaxID=3451555 RepID=UPI003F751AF4
MNNFLHQLLREVGLTADHFTLLCGLAKTVSLTKKEFLLQTGTTCSFIGFVEVGVLRSFVQKEGDEFNIDFYLPHAFVCAYTSFLTQTPAAGSIQALADTKIKLISYADYHSLLAQDDSWHRLGKHISDQLFVRKCKREISFLTDSASERYKALLANYPTIEQLVAQYHIAAYLGIKPESLSRIKSLTYINA